MGRPNGDPLLEYPVFEAAIRKGPGTMLVNANRPSRPDRVTAAAPPAFCVSLTCAPATTPPVALTTRPRTTVTCSSGPGGGSGQVVMNTVPFPTAMVGVWS